MELAHTILFLAGGSTGSGGSQFPPDTTYNWLNITLTFAVIAAVAIMLIVWKRHTLRSRFIGWLK